MQRCTQKLREDARKIWWAGVEAVQPQRLIPEHVAVTGDVLWLDGQEVDLRTIDRIAVVGAGKAGAGMTLALEAALGDKLLEEKRVTGWVNIPEGCFEPTRRVRLHAARPASLNEPRPEGVAGSAEILRLVGQLGPRDLCLCLISGGGSALLPAPIDGLSLEEKIVLTREISARGGTIQQLNQVRRELSFIKGGRLAHACQAGKLVSLILSDVLGDDLEIIASGPTVPRRPTPLHALQVLEQLQLSDHSAATHAVELLQQQLERTDPSSAPVATSSHVRNILIGNNATAVDAAGMEAERLGYNHAMISATQSEGTAESVAAHLIEMARSMRGSSDSAGDPAPASLATSRHPDCLISGGEPTVVLAQESSRGQGGRNQQLALKALSLLEDWRGLALLAGGTDGEDGPTDAAGAIVDESIAAEARAKQTDLADYLCRNDAYRCFDEIGGLLKTGPTGTNVCDVRVLVVDRQ